MNVLGVSTDDAGEILDLMANTAQTSATDISGLYESVVNMGGVSKMFAGGNQELFTMLGILGDMGYTGSTAGIALRNMMIRLIAPTTKASDAMDQLGMTEEEMLEELDDLDDEKLKQIRDFMSEKGFSVFDSQGKMKTFLQIFTNLDETLERLDNGQLTEESLGILSAIFPTRSIAYAKNLLDFVHNTDTLIEDGKKTWTDYTHSADEYSGSAEYMAESMESGIVGALNRVTAKWETLELVIGEKIAPTVEKVANKLENVIDWANGLDDETVERIVTVGEVIVGAAGAFKLVGGIFKFGTGVLRLAQGFGRFATALGPVPAVMLAAGAGIAFLYGHLDKNATEALLLRTNFGELQVTTDGLGEHLETLETKFSGAADTIAEKTDKLNTIAGKYASSETGLMQLLMNRLLTGGKLSEGDRKDASGYADNLVTYLINEIQTASGKSGTFLQSLFAGNTSIQQFLDADTGYYGGLITQAESIGQELRDKMVSALEDGELDDSELAAIRATIERMNKIEAEVQESQSEVERAAMLERGMRMGYDTIDDFNAEYNEYVAGRIEEMYQQGYSEIANGRLYKGWTDEQADIAYQALEDQVNAFRVNATFDQQKVVDRWMRDNGFMSNAEGVATYTDPYASYGVETLVNRLLRGNGAPILNDEQGQLLWEKLGDNADTMYSMEAANAILDAIAGQVIEAAGSYKIGNNVMSGSELLNYLALTGFVRGDLDGVHAYMRDDGYGNTELVALDRAVEAIEGFVPTLSYLGIMGLSSGYLPAEYTAHQIQLEADLTSIREKEGTANSYLSQIVSNTASFGFLPAISAMLRLSGKVPAYAEGGRA